MTDEEHLRLDMESVDALLRITERYLQTGPLTHYMEDQMLVIQHEAALSHSAVLSWLMDGIAPIYRPLRFEVINNVLPGGKQPDQIVAITMALGPDALPTGYLRFYMGRLQQHWRGSYGYGYYDVPRIDQPDQQST